MSELTKRWNQALAWTPSKHPCPLCAKPFRNCKHKETDARHALNARYIEEMLRVDEARTTA